MSPFVRSLLRYGVVGAAVFVLAYAILFAITGGIPVIFKSHIKAPQNDYPWYFWAITGFIFASMFRAAVHVFTNKWQDGFVAVAAFILFFLSALTLSPVILVFLTQFFG